MAKERKLNRRQFLTGVAVTAGGVVLAACAPEVVKETVIVKETVVVEKPVEKVVEKIITAVPLPSRYNEAPMLAELVKAGSLPPVEERIPSDPYVIKGLDGIGNYGGTLRQSCGAPGDQYAWKQLLRHGLLKGGRP